MAYYATVRDRGGLRVGWLAGPYLTHGAAQRASESCRAIARRTPSTRADAAFAAFGTSRITTRAAQRRVGAGRWNHLVTVKDGLP